jgi:(5-formylfuran-3-yl)methyl phosphate synthase
MIETTQLLVSVRSAAEAMIALEGGAALIDVKEPARGSLGRADTNVIREVVGAVGGRRPVSAALGEWIEGGLVPDADLAYVKWGLAGCDRNADWRREFTRLLNHQRRPQVVLVAYADAECAQAPPVEDVFALAIEHPGSVMLLDTHCKDSRERRTLLDWLPAPWVVDLCTRARGANVKIALAGSLGIAEMRTLLPARPDWFAVRGAACEDSDRQAGLQLVKVRQLVQMLRES